MPARPHRATRTLIATVAITAATATAAPANTGFPNIHTPRLYGVNGVLADPVLNEFGGILDIYIGNSGGNTLVTACISNHCRRLYPDHGNRYGAAGSYFNVRLYRDQQRTVKITATNGSQRTQWGPAKITVR